MGAAAETTSNLDLSLYNYPYVAGGPQWSPDGQNLYYARVLRAWPAGFAQSAPQATERYEVSVRKFSLSSRSETELLRRATDGSFRVLESPDGKYLLTAIQNAAPRTVTVLLIPTDGSPATDLVTSSAGVGLGLVMWAPDSQSVFIRRNSGNGQVETWRYTLSGDGRPVGPAAQTNLGGAHVVSPDGSRVAFTTNSGPSQVRPYDLYAIDRLIE